MRRTARASALAGAVVRVRTRWCTRVMSCVTLQQMGSRMGDLLVGQKTWMPSVTLQQMGLGTGDRVEGQKT